MLVSKYMSIQEANHTVESSPGSVADCLVPHVPPDSPAVRHIRVLPQHTPCSKAHHPPHFGSQTTRLLITVVIPSCEYKLGTANLVQNLIHLLIEQIFSYKCGGRVEGNSCLKLPISREPHDHVPAPASSDTAKHLCTIRPGVRQDGLHPFRLSLASPVRLLGQPACQVLSFNIPPLSTVEVWQYDHVATVRQLVTQLTCTPTLKAIDIITPDDALGGAASPVHLHIPNLVHHSLVIPGVAGEGRVSIGTFRTATWHCVAGMVLLLRLCFVNEHTL